MGGKSRWEGKNQGKRLGGSLNLLLCTSTGYVPDGRCLHLYPLKFIVWKRNHFGGMDQIKPISVCVTLRWKRVWPVNLLPCRVCDQQKHEPLDSGVVLGFKIRGCGWPLKQPERKFGVKCRLWGFIIYPGIPLSSKRGCHKWPPKAVRNPKLGVIFEKCAPRDVATAGGGGRQSPALTFRAHHW